MTFDFRDRRPSLVLLLALLVPIAACAKRSAEEVDSDAPVSVKTAAAALGSIRGLVHATGVVNPAPGAELVVVAPEAARIAEVPFAAGDRVRRGDVLVRFEIPTLAADVQKQQAEVRRAQAALDNARAAQTRARDLFERGVAARKEMEDTTRAAAEADAALAQAQAALASSEALAGRTVVRATFDGLVAKRHHNPGDFVEASAGDPVLRVIDPHRLEVLASVPIADYSRIAVGAAARLVSAPGADAPAATLKVVSRPAAVDVGTATVPVRLGFAGAADFPAGAPVQVDIDAEQHQGVVLVPAVAIVRNGDETALFVAADKKAQRRAVQIGLTDGTSVEIVSGVRAGEPVIVDGQAGLPDNAAIVVNDDGAKAPAAEKPAAKDDGK